MKEYSVIAKTSEESSENEILFYKEDGKVWISLCGMEERGFTFDEVHEIIDKLNECISAF